MPLFRIVGTKAAPRHGAQHRTVSRSAALRRTALACGSVIAMACAAPSLAASDDAAAASRSAMDAPLLYQVLIGELELSAGRSSQAFEVLFDAARRTRDENLFKRSVQVALQSRSIDHVQSAVTTWRRSVPQSIEAMRYQMQIAVAMNRVGDAAEAFIALVGRTPAEERVGLITALPSVIERLADHRQTAAAFEPALMQVSQSSELRAVSLATLGRLWLAASDPDKALDLATQAHAADTRNTTAVGLALELLPRSPKAEALVKGYLAAPGAETSVRVAYGQALAQQQRQREALDELQRAVTDTPNNASAWLTIGALHLEQKHPADAERALQRYLELSPAGPAGVADTDTEDGLRAVTVAAGRAQAFLMLSQAAELRGDFAAATAWLDRVDVQDRRSLDVLFRRASMLAKQGKVAEARALIAAAPEQSADDARAKVVAEAQVLRDAKRWQEAFDLLAGGVGRFPDDVDLRYEQAMMAEKLNRMDTMEALLRQVMATKPDHQHAYNALGYSLADRGLRLEEARQLVSKALELAPGDPFITDSLGWVEFRRGNNVEALRLLREAWARRPDTEIGAHLGEVLWVAGDKDEARRIWREAKARDADNDVLRETLRRLKVDP